MQMLDSPPSLSILCPFEIKGDACPKTVLGYVIQKNSSLTIMCESNVFGGYASPTPDQASCVIDCPGNLFTVETNASLTIDGLRLKGSQNAPAIDVQSKGEFQAFETTFENNSNPFGNGGAIHSGEGSRLLVTLCEFTNNTSLNGGAIYAEGTSQISNSDFVDNIANQTTSRAGVSNVATFTYSI